MSNIADFPFAKLAMSIFFAPVRFTFTGLICKHKIESLVTVKTFILFIHCEVFELTGDSILCFTRFYTWRFSSLIGIFVCDAAFTNGGCAVDIVLRAGVITIRHVGLFVTNIAVYRGASAIRGALSGGKDKTEDIVVYAKMLFCVSGFTTAH